MGVLNVDTGFTEDGVGKTHNIPVSGKYLFYAVGTFGNGCLSLETSPDGANWFTVDQLTGPGRLIRYLVTGEKIRLSLVDGISPVITVGIRQ